MTTDSHTIFVIGKNGQLAKALGQLMPNARFFGRPDIDLTQAKTLDTIPWHEAAAVINASAYTNVDEAETAAGRILAWQTNADGVHLLAQKAGALNIPLVHVSTDYVFDGTSGNYSEDNPLGPLNTYGQSKAAGEYAARTLQKHYIVRTQWLIGSGKNFVRTMYDLGHKGVHPAVVADQIGRLTFTDTLARAIVHLLEHQSPYGVYHVSNEGSVVSWADIAETIFLLANLNNHVTRITTADWHKQKPTSAPRPLQTDFNLSKIQSTGFTPPPWNDTLAEFVQKLEQANSQLHNPPL
jgi:dTDP-4-dehydrorhamnose 3,5-epimerase